MYRQRTKDDIKTLRDLLSLIKGGEKAKVYCDGGREGDPGVPPGAGGTKAPGKCGKNITDFAGKAPIHDGEHENLFVKCPRCGRWRMFSGPWLWTQVRQAMAKKAAGLAPVSGTFPDVEPLQERPLPDGRKLIIAVPRAAVAGGRVPQHGGR
jgi:hypothetical protein